MRKEFVEYVAKYRADIDEMVKRGSYKKVHVASAYVERDLAPSWRPVLGIDDYDEPLVSQLNLSDTMILMLHLFGKAVHHHSTQRTKLPLLTHWQPIWDKDWEKIRWPWAISKGDIAKCIGRSRSAVDDATNRFRGKTEKYELLYSKRVAYALYSETGIMLDVMTHPNLSFGFVYEDYAYTKRVAREARLSDAETNHKQESWSTDAMTDLDRVAGRRPPVDAEIIDITKPVQQETKPESIQ